MYMTLEANPFIIESLVVQEDSTTHELKTDSSCVENLNCENLKLFMLEVVKHFIVKAGESLEKISATLVYNVGADRFLYQLIFTDAGVEEYSTNPAIPSETFTKEMLDSGELI